MSNKNPRRRHTRRSGIKKRWLRVVLKVLLVLSVFFIPAFTMDYSNTVLPPALQGRLWTPMWAIIVAVPLLVLLWDGASRHRILPRVCSIVAAVLYVGGMLFFGTFWLNRHGGHEEQLVATGEIEEVYKPFSHKRKSKRTLWVTQVVFDQPAKGRAIVLQTFPEPMQKGERHEFLLCKGMLGFYRVDSYSIEQETQLQGTPVAAHTVYKANGWGHYWDTLRFSSHSN